MTRELRATLAAVTFLTRLPIAGRLALGREDVERAGAYFPLVGAAIGSSVAALAERAGPDAAVVAGALATGALHLDALADVADACGAGSRERALEVMRDPRVGAFGATAIVCDLLLKRSALAAVAEHPHAARVGLAAGALSRTTPVLLAAALPYARSDGTAAALSRGGGSRATAAAVIALVAASTALGRDGVRLAAATTGLTVAAAAVLNRWLGGVTGDALGASLELTETALLLAAGRR
jgi:adenosylcobinamide-GDP ribazoletransferase